MHNIKDNFLTCGIIRDLIANGVIQNKLMVVT
jgi:hypothetical protein